MPDTTLTPRETNHRDVILAVHELLLSELSDIFTEETLVYTDEPEPPPAQAIDKLFATLSPSESEFPDDVQTGGAAATVEELTGLTIVVYSTMRLDQVGRMPGVIFDPEQGLFEIKRRILKALVGEDPQANAKLLLSDCIKVRRSGVPRKDDKQNYFLTLEFGISFFWDLT